MSIREKLGDTDYEFLLSSTMRSSGSARLKSVLSRESLNIGFVGGSVTTGYSPAGLIEKCFADLTVENIAGLTGKKCRGLNLGVSGPSSFMGLTLAENDFKAFPPDIVFVEYAVNEALSQTGTRHFESLIRKLLQLESKPCVVLVIVFSEERYTCQEYMLHLAQHYDIGAVALMDAMTPFLNDGRLKWSDYCDDNVHPSADGQRFIADCILNYLKRAMSEPTTESVPLPPPVFGAAYENVRLLDLSDKRVQKYGFSFRDYSCVTIHTAMNKALENEPEANEHFIEITLKCRCLCIVYVTDNDRCGEATVSVDGEEVGTLQGYSLFGWNNPVFKIVLYENEAKQHKFTLAMSKGEEKKRFAVLAVSYCD